MANRVYGYQGYNKGYQFETSPKKLQPEYEPNEQNNPTRKVKTKTKTDKQNILDNFNLLLIISLLH